MAKMSTSSSPVTTASYSPDTALRGNCGPAIEAVGLTVTHPTGTTALDRVTVTITPGRLTAVIGPSGAGKSTLLKALAGIVPAQQGAVAFTTDGACDPEPTVGFVPQDDVLHADLPLRRTLQHAARLRIAAPRDTIDAAVTDALRILGLTDRGDVPVHSLSGGQRKRASIASEILTRPGVCFLDEPTSGLDPASAADLVSYLHRLSSDGSTVVFSTHRVEDITRSDQVIIVGRGGRLVAVGTPGEVLRRLGAATFVELYGRLTNDDLPRANGDRVGVAHPSPSVGSSWAARPSGIRQWRVLTRRSFELLLANRLTLAIIVGSPAAVIGMFAVLFRPRALQPGADGQIAGVQVAYWLAFAGFFFGLTFGLLQVCTEVPVLQRERHSGVRIGAYVASKLAVLTPLLLMVNAAMLTVLRLLGRIPPLSTGAAAELYLTMGLNAVAALCLGLLASALVGSPAQAALALPMLCFPAVLFAGAVVPLSVMTGPGRVIAAMMPDRWAFEAIAGRLGVRAFADTRSPYASLGASEPLAYWVVLLFFTGFLGAGAYLAVRWRAAVRPRARGGRTAHPTQAIGPKRALQRSGKV
jgi:ABC-type multidrug transport system ATPase subunit